MTRRQGQLLGAAAVIAVLAALTWWSWSVIADTSLFPGNYWERAANFLRRMFPPDTQVTRSALDSMGETLQMTFLSTLFSVALSIPLGVLAAETLVPPVVHVPVKALLGAVRAVPLILLALFFVSTAGLGPLPGILALTIHSTSMLAKFFAETFEGARQGPVEALRSAGAGYWQRLRFAVLPQTAPDLVRDVLFRFELNLRESLVLGLVGAGGIGFDIQLYVRAFQFQKAATLTIIILAVVVVIEQITAQLRRLVR